MLLLDCPSCWKFPSLLVKIFLLHWTRVVPLRDCSSLHGDSSEGSGLRALAVVKWALTRSQTRCTWGSNARESLAFCPQVACLWSRDDVSSILYILYHFNNAQTMESALGTCSNQIHTLPLVTEFITCYCHTPRVMSHSTMQLHPSTSELFWDLGSEFAWLYWLG